MRLGQVRDRFPRVMLTLPGQNGPFDVEFVVDTGFDGELAVPADIARRLDGGPAGRRSLYLADASLVISPYYEVVLRWNGAARTTEVLALDGNPLLGVVLLNSHLLQIEMEEGGEVSLEPF